MGIVANIVLIFLVAGALLAGVAYFVYRNLLRRAKGIERGLKMVPMLIHLPPPSDDTAASGRDVRDVMREKVAQADVLYNLIAGTTTKGFKSSFYGQRHIALEIIASQGLIHFYAAVPVALVSVVEKAILTAYPGAKLEEAEDYNLFHPTAKLAGTAGGELALRENSAYPIATFKLLDRDPMEGLLNALSSLSREDGAGIQILLRPAGRSWAKRAVALARKRRKNGGSPTTLNISTSDVLKAAVKAPSAPTATSNGSVPLSKLDEDIISAIEDKTRYPAYEVLIRIVASGATPSRAQQIVHDLVATFALFNAPGLNGFKYIPAKNLDGLITAFIFRFFPPEFNHEVLNSVELATLFHLPDAQFTSTAQLERQSSKQVDGPVSIPQTGLLVGYNVFRGVKKEIRLGLEDRRRHTYIVGQTGTGKSTLLENLAVQDMLAGNGFAFIDPHGDTAEKLISMVPKSRVEDIIYFNPADTDFPLGLNLFEFTSPEQKDFLIQETINMLYKLYDPGHTGIIGPRYEHWFRNAALTLMADPAGASFIEIPKVFTDTEYLKRKFKYLTDPTVIEFWTKEMGQTSDYHKSEMLGWFVSKFGAFMSNEMMRNIIGQTKSSFNLRDIMDNKKILIVNLSKGRLGELNSQLLGMIFVMKFQAAAMSRADMPEDQRDDFCLYVDEFQNFSTDSFASILSEARKYRLNLVVANQFVGQLTPQIRDAVFGNVGSIISYRTGPEDADFLVKQFAPVFDARDLVNIPNHNSVIRLMIGGLPSQPFTMQMLPPLGMANLELGLAMKQLSAAKYGISKRVVEADIAARLSGKAPVLSPSAPPPLPASAPPSAPSLTPDPNLAPSQTPMSSGQPSPAVVPPPSNAVAAANPGAQASPPAGLTTAASPAVSQRSPGLAPLPSASSQSVAAAPSPGPAQPAGLSISDITRTPTPTAVPAPAPTPVPSVVPTPAPPAVGAVPSPAPVMDAMAIQKEIDSLLGSTTNKPAAPAAVALPEALPPVVAPPQPLPAVTPPSFTKPEPTAVTQPPMATTPIGPPSPAQVNSEPTQPAASGNSTAMNITAEPPAAPLEAPPEAAVKSDIQTQGSRHYVDHGRKAVGMPVKADHFSRPVEMEPAEVGPAAEPTQEEVKTAMALTHTNKVIQPLHKIEKQKLDVEAILRAEEAAAAPLEPTTALPRPAESTADTEATAAAQPIETVFGPMLPAGITGPDSSRLAAPLEPTLNQPLPEAPAATAQQPPSDNVPHPGTVKNEPAVTQPPTQKGNSKKPGKILGRLSELKDKIEERIDTEINGEPILNTNTDDKQPESTATAVPIEVAKLQVDPVAPAPQPSEPLPSQPAEPTFGLTPQGSPVSDDQLLAAVSEPTPVVVPEVPREGTDHEPEPLAADKKSAKEDIATKSLSDEELMAAVSGNGTTESSQVDLKDLPKVETRSEESESELVETTATAPAHKKVEKHHKKPIASELADQVKQATPVPKLSPGEIFVDDDGIVHQG